MIPSSGREECVGCKTAGKMELSLSWTRRACWEGPPFPVLSGKDLTWVFFSFQEKDVTPDKNLLSKVREAALWLETSDSRLAQPSHSTTASIADFFLALTICNSVMVSTTTEPRKRVRMNDGWDCGQGREKSVKTNRKRETPNPKDMTLQCQPCVISPSLRNPDQPCDS